MNALQLVITTLAWLALGLAVAFACGYGVVSFLLPPEQREFRWVVMAPTGYLSFCVLVMVISGNFDLGVRLSTWAALLLLLILAVGAWFHERRARAPSPENPARLLAVLILPTLLAVLWPLLVQGLELFQGSVNLDFYQSLVYQELLGRHDLPVFANYKTPGHTYSAELAANFWPDTLQARFGGVVFSYLLQSIGGLSAKSALTTAGAVFALCLPLSIYFFSRAVMGLSRNVAMLSSALIAISAPISLGFLYVLVGQGSGMPILPLLIAMLFLALTRPSLKLIAYSTVLVWGLFWLYALMMPFALAPMGLFAAYLLARRRLSIAWATAFLAIVAGAALVLWSGMLPHLAGFFQGLASVSGRLVGTVYFADFLTEMFFAYFLGVTSYTASNSVFYYLTHQLLPAGFAWHLAVAVTTWLVAFVILSLRAWWRSEPSDDRRKAVASILAVYALVWAYFTFVKPYGYSAFKMVTWLQFSIVPLAACGLASLAQRIGARRLPIRLIAALSGLLLVVTNLIATMDYGRMSFGTDRERGYIINSFGVGNNPDYATLGRDVAKVVSPSQRVGLIFTDATQNHWAAYRLWGVAPHSVLIHRQLAEDDAFLPDPVTGETLDSSGETKKIAPLAFEDVSSDYYLMPAPGNLNPEIVQQDLPAPAWGNATFHLHARDRMQDFMFLGRGFYRGEFERSIKPWWQPKGASRWTRKGGEFYLLQASRPGKPYRLAFTAMVGFGLPSAARTLEFWHGATKFDEIVINDTARVISAPFYPAGKLDRITVAVKELPDAVPRSQGLWGKSVPDDTRRLNVLVSSATFIGPDDKPPRAIQAGRIRGNDILDSAYRFNGLSPSRWVGDRAMFSFVTPYDNPRLDMDIMVPGNLGFSFPYTVALVVDGIERRFVAPRPGPLNMSLHLPGKRALQPVEVLILPQAHKEIDDPFARRNRPIVQSILLEALQVSQGER